MEIQIRSDLIFWVWREFGIQSESAVCVCEQELKGKERDDDDEVDRRKVEARR